MADAPLPPGTTPGRLGDKIERTMMRFLIRVYNSTIGLLSQRIRAGLDRWTEEIETTMVGYYGPILDQILESPDLSPQIRHLLERIRHPTSQAGWLLAVQIAGMAASGTISGAVNPIARKVGHWVDAWARSAIPDPNTLASLLWRGAFGDDTYYLYLRNLGIPPDMIETMKEIARPRLGVGDLYAFARRFQEDLAIARSELVKRGYDGPAIDKLQSLTEFMPGPADLVRMGVREAWRDDVAARWGYDADFPGQFAVEMRRLGDTENWAQKFWRAHWVLPSVTMGLEMLHRQVITDAEFAELLRISDIPAGWRSRIEQIAYIPYTRVDTRRMFRFGVLDESEVYQTYLDLGYDAEHAENMALFAILDATEEERAVTKADILTAYRLGRLSNADAHSALVDTGLNAWVASIQLANVDTKRANEIATERIGYVRTMYVNDYITRGSAVAQLGAVGIPGAEIDRYIAEWSVAREAKIKRPTRTNLASFFKRDIISHQAYHDMLWKLGYREPYITWYVQESLAEKAEGASKEAERARKEQEDIETRTVTTAYQRDKAILAVEMAELATAIAETQIAIGARGDRYQADRALATEAISVDTLRRTAQVDVDRIQTDIDALSIEIGQMRVEIDARETETARIRESLLEAAEGTQIAALQAEIALLRVEIEGIQDLIAGQRATVTEHKVTISEADVPPEVVSLTEEIDTLSVEIGEAYVLIEVLQTDIARWMEQAFTTEEVEPLDTIRANILHARLQIEQIQDIVAEHRVAITAAKVRLRALDIPPEIQALIADIDSLTISIRYGQVAIEQIQTAVVEHRAQIEQEDRTERDREILLQIAQLERENEESQDAIRLLERDRDVARGDLRRRREKRNRDIANLERVRNVVLVERQYDEDVAEMNRRLGELRLNSMELKEQLAGLTVEYRTGLAS